MLWKCCTQYASKFGKLSSDHRTAKGQFSFQSQRRTMPKNVQSTTQLYSFHMLAKKSENESRWVVFDSLWPHGLYSPRNSPGQSTGVGSHSLLQGIFLTQGPNPGFPHCRWTLYQLSHKGKPRMLEWVAYPFIRRPSQPRNWTGVSYIAGRFFTNWAIREAPSGNSCYTNI